MRKLPLPDMDRSIEVARDENGIPQISADNWLDALFGLGYVHALDRGTQMLFSRSVASGSGAEQIANKEELLETDRLFRRIALRRGLEREVELLSDEIRDQLTAYCAGVNKALETGGRSLPMWATGFQPEAWDEISILLIGKLLSFGGLVVSQMQNERLLLELIHAGVNDVALRELFEPLLDGVDFELLRSIKMANQISDEALELITDLPRLAGSNAWAVSAEKSATGHALLASDPHLEVNRLPAIWYEAVLRWDDRYVMGATLPGCPLFAVARTESLAWGVTYMKGDTVDYFIEECRHAEGKWQYRRDQKWFDFDCRREEIGRKGAESEELLVFENAQGTMDGDLNELGEGLHLSLAWGGNHDGGGGAIASWLEVVAARGAQEAMHRVRHCPQPTLCWMFADRDNHIGLQTCGRIPIRGGGHLGLTPIPAWDEANHWQGWVPAASLPAEYDPECGFIATANEPMNPPDLPMLVTQPLPGYRKRRIVQQLSEWDTVTLEQMQDLQYDLVSLQAKELLELFLPHLPEGELKERLSQWDCQYGPDSLEAPLFQQLYVNVMCEILGHERGIGWRRLIYLCSRAGYSMMVMRAADGMIKRDDSSWWQDRSRAEIVQAAAERTPVHPERRWKQVNNFHFADRFFGTHQVGRILGFKSRSYPMPGNHATPFQGHVLQTATRETTFAPSYHFVTDLGTDEAWTNLPGGPSESRFSKFYKNDVQRWFTGEYKRLTPHSESESAGEIHDEA